MIIKETILQTSKFDDMLIFYKQQLKLNIISENHSQFTVKIGESLLTFESTIQGNPFYHFAFDVPKQLFNQAKGWISSNVELNSEDGENEIFFKHLDARSIYFYDPSGNIVELIGRHETNELDFTPNCLSRISEMSIVVQDVSAAADLLIATGIRERDNEILINSLNFMCTRQDKVYLLLVKEGRKWLFSNKHSTSFPLTIITDTHQITINNAQLNSTLI